MTELYLFENFNFGSVYSIKCGGRAFVHYIHSPYFQETVPHFLHPLHPGDIVFKCTWRYYCLCNFFSILQLFSINDCTSSKSPCLQARIKLLDILHVSVFIYLLCSIFLKNKVIIGISLCLILFIQLMWIIMDKCLLNEENETWGYGNELAIGSFLLTILLIYKIIY